MTKTKAAASLIFITAIFLAFNNARAEEDPTVGEVLEQKTTKPKQSVRVAADKLPAGASKNKGIVVRARVTKLSGAASLDRLALGW